MQKNIPMGVALLAVGVGSALTVAGADGEGPQALTVAVSLLSGACTALGVTALIVGWAGRNTDKDSGH